MPPPTARTLPSGSSTLFAQTRPEFSEPTARQDGVAPEKSPISAVALPPPEPFGPPNSSTLFEPGSRIDEPDSPRPPKFVSAEAAQVFVAGLKSWVRAWLVQAILPFASRCTRG